MRTAWRTWLSACGLALAVSMLLLLFLPGSVWHHPINDAIYRGIDPNLVFISPRGDGDSEGSIRFDRGNLELSAVPLSAPTANLLTTPLHQLDVSLDVVVLRNPAGSAPLRIGLWSPTTGSGYFISFHAGNPSLITAETIVSGFPGHTLLAGDIARTEPLGSYATGRSYHLDIAADKERGAIVATVSDRNNVLQSHVTIGDLPRLFQSVRISLTASARASSAASTVLLKNYRLTLPHERIWADKVDDPRAGLALLGLSGLGGILLLIAAVGWLRKKKAASPRLDWVMSLTKWPSIHLRRPRTLLIAGGVVVLAYLIFNGLLFALGGHPFDMANEKLYAYVAARMGPWQLYYAPNLVSFPSIWNGVPYTEAAFPYEPGLAYVFTATGWIASVVLGSAAFTTTSMSLEYIIKAVNVTFGLADAVLIYLILRTLKIDRRWSLIGALLFLFNPAVWFSMSVWGQTHVISIFFVLGAILFGQRDHPLGAWIFIVAAAGTRPQMLAVAFLMGVVLFRKFRLRENLAALSWTVIIVFLLLLPFTLQTNPALPVDIMANTVQSQEGGGNDPGQPSVSEDAYSIWPLVTYVKYGASGPYRSFFPSSQPLWGTLTYQRAGLVATTIALLAISFLILRRRRPDIDAGAYLPLLALGFIAFMMFMTGLVATHFLLALPLLILCRRWMSTGAYLLVVVGWTITTLVPMYGDMGNVISNLTYPLLSRDHNSVTRFFVALYSWDRFITFATLGNILILLWITAVAIRSRVESGALQAAA